MKDADMTFTAYIRKVGNQWEGIVAELGQIRVTDESDYYNRTYTAPSEHLLLGALRGVVVSKFAKGEESTFIKGHPRPEGWKRVYIAVTKIEVEAYMEANNG